jgi:MSHA biogenesis protein MshP
MKNILMSLRYKAQRGFTLVTAIFLLVVLAGLGAAMLAFSTAQQQSSTLDILGSRAYQASRAGIEWAAFQIVQSGVAAPPAGAGGFAALCQAATTSSSLSFAGTLSPFSVTVACNASSAVENSATVWMYGITSTATGVAGATVGSADYVERQMTVTIAQ